MFNFIFKSFFDLLFGTSLFLESHRLVFSLKDLLFTFQCTFSFNLRGVNESYFSIPFSCCQYFFKIFLKYFFALFLGQNKKLVFDVFFVLCFTFITNFLCVIFNILSVARYKKYLNTDVDFCQHFFWIFLKFFSKLFCFCFFTFISARYFLY